MSHKNGIITSKQKLWKKQSIIEDIISYMDTKNYQFLELVIGEPNNFIFADALEEVPGLFKKKGYHGMRLKFQKDDILFEIHCNTSGMDNVLYSIYVDEDDHWPEIEVDIQAIKDIIGSSNPFVVRSQEFLHKHSYIQKIILGVILVIGLYYLNVHILLWSAFHILYQFIPFLFLYLLLSRLFRS